MLQPRAVLPPALVLLVAVAAMSWAGPLIRFATAPAPVIAAWRLIFSVLCIAVVLLLRRSKIASLNLTTGEWALALAAGVLLAAHFWVWIASLSMTSVASSVVLVSMQPIFVAGLSALLLHERATGRQWLGILLAFAGAAIIGLGDWHGGTNTGRTAVVGDLLALTGAVLVSGYYVIGRRLRPKLDLGVYIGIVYGIAALLLVLVVALDPQIRLIGYPAGDWLVFGALAAGPMMLGHTGVNYALRYVPAYVANMALLGEPVGATLIAWALPQLREVPTVVTAAGTFCIGVGIALAASQRRKATAA